jgi:hypothetical protein
MLPDVWGCIPQTEAYFVTQLPAHTPPPPEIATPRLPVDDEQITSAVKLYVTEKVADARNHSMVVFGAISVFLTIAAGFGIYEGAKSYVETKFNSSTIKALEAKAETSAERANNAVKTAESRIPEIDAFIEKAKRADWENRVKALEQSHASLQAKLDAAENIIANLKSTKVDAGQVYNIKSVMPKDPNKGVLLIGIHHGKAVEGNELDVAEQNATAAQDWIFIKK